MGAARGGIVAPAFAVVFVTPGTAAVAAMPPVPAVAEEVHDDHSDHYQEKHPVFG
jgi:hypothetical protein